jgi:DNA-binding CsgD family transcriptional regulator
MVAAVVQHRFEGLVDRCHTGLDLAGFTAEVLRRLPGIVPAEAAFLATVDPATLLFTSAVAQGPLREQTARFLDNEFGCEDVNKFADLARGQDPVTSLDRATRGERASSVRYREIMAPLGLGDELRAVLVAGHQCWGVLCLHLADAEAGFSDRDHDLVRALAPHLAEGIRQAIILDASAPQPLGAPGMLVLDAGLGIVSINPQAERWLAQIPDTRPDGLPFTVAAAAARLVAQQPQTDGDSADAAASDVRLRTREGRLLRLHASHLKTLSGPQIGLIIEPVPASELGSLLLSAYGLTDAQSRVVGLVLKGYSTREIVDELHISANTVQEHLTAVFDRLGVRSRRELIAALLTRPGH